MESLNSLLAYKNLGSILFDTGFNIIEINPIAERILKSAGIAPDISHVLELFPELIGNEGLIENIIKKRNKDYRLDYINRLNDEGQIRYLNLLVLPAVTTNNALLVLDDVTERAQAMQAINQQKYELFLYKRDSDFRKKIAIESILGKSATIQNIRDTIQKLSKIPSATVLLMGETGTGKNLAALGIHYSSMPSDAPFVEINCAALPEHLIESELFGYEKGAFTHAIAAKPGLLEEAHRGSLFLDEIAELSLNMQAKLLSVLETKKFRRLGSNKAIQIDTRIITATNRNLQEAVQAHKFRQDLFYRLNVVSLTMPPLRELGDDIMLISEHLLRMFNIEFKKEVKGFNEDARRALLAYSWPGNVRELSNCIERAMIFADSEYITESDLVIFSRPSQLSAEKDIPWSIPPGGIDLEEVERQLIRSALDKSGNNKSKAARLLGLTRDTLRYRLEKYRLA